MSEENSNPISCVEIISFGVFILGTLVLFAKTSDLMTNFAPSEFMGYVQVEGIYGLAVALMVEGLMVAMKIKMMFQRSKNIIEWAWDTVLTFVPFVVSALAQSIDSMVIKETLDSQPSEIQLFVTWGVPAIPAFIIFLILVRGVIDSAPPGLFDTGKSGKSFSWPKFKNPFTGKSKKAPPSQQK